MMKNNRWEKFGQTWAGLRLKQENRKSICHVYDIVEENGKISLIYPWGQKIEYVDHATEFFWRTKEDLVQALSEEKINIFVHDLSKKKSFSKAESDAFKKILSEFVAGVFEEAKESQIKREESRIEEVREVRMTYMEKNELEEEDSFIATNEEMDMK